MKQTIGFILLVIIVSISAASVSAQTGSVGTITFPNGRPNCSGNGSVFITVNNPTNSSAWVTATTGIVSERSVGFGEHSVSLSTSPENNVYDGVFKLTVRFGPERQSSRWYKETFWYNCANGQNTDVSITSGSDYFTIPSDLTSRFYVLSNDSSRLSFTSTIVSAQASNGVASPDGLGYFKYTPNPGFIGSDSFMYRVCNSGGRCQAGNVYLTVFRRPLPTVTDVRLTQTTCEGTGILEVDLVYQGNEAWVTAYSAIEDLEDISTTNTFLVGDRTILMDVSSAGVVVDGFAVNIEVLYGETARSDDWFRDDYWFNCDTGQSLDTSITANSDSFNVPEDFEVSYNIVSNDNSVLPLDYGTLEVIAGPSRGIVTIGGDGIQDADGTITYQLTDGVFSGTDEFTYRICNVDGQCDTTTVVVTVNDLPPHEITSVGLSQTSCDGLAILDVDVIYSGHQGWLTSTIPTSQSVIDITNDDLESFGDEFNVPMELNVTPADLVDGYILRVDTLYGVASNDDTYDSETIFFDCVTGLPIDTEISAVDDTLTVAESFPRRVNVVSNDETNLPTDNSTLSIVSAPARGTATPYANGEIEYTLTDGIFSGTDTFDYEVCNIAGECSTATVTISVIDLPPHEILEVSLVEVTCDAEGTAAITVQYSGGPGFVTVETGITEVVDITSDAFEDYTSQTLNVPISSANGAVSGDNVLTMTVLYGTSRNDDSYDSGVYYFDCETGNPITPIVDAVDDDGGQVESADELEIDILANDTSRLPLDTDTLQILNEPAGGDVELVDNKVLFTPDPNYAGTTTFDYEICNTGGFCDTATVSIVVVDVTPECDVLTPYEESTAWPPREIIVVLVDNIDYDPATGNIFYDIVNVARVRNGVPTMMSVSDIDWGVRKDLINAETSGYNNWRSYAVHYAPPGPYPRNCAGTAYVYVQATDFVLTCDSPAVDIREIRYGVGDDESDISATDCITGLEPNSLLFALNDTVSGAESGTTITVDVLTNDLSQFSFDLATLEITEQPSGASASVVGDMIEVAIDEGTTGSVNLSYQVCNINGGCDSADVTITVGGVSVASARISENPTPMSLPLTTFEEPLAVASNTDTSTGDGSEGSQPTDSINNEAASATSTPAPDNSGQEEEGSEESTPNPTPTPAPTQDPFVVARDLTVARSMSSTETSINVLQNDHSDYPMDTNSLSITSSPGIGSASIQNGMVVYRGNGTSGVTSFSYNICNSAGNCDSATVTVILAHVTAECEGFVVTFVDGVPADPIPANCEVVEPPVVTPEPTEPPVVTPEPTEPPATPEATPEPTESPSATPEPTETPVEPE